MTRRAPLLPALLAAAILPLAAEADPEGVFGPLPLKEKDAELIEKSGELEGYFRRKGYVLPHGPETELVQRVGAALAPEPASDPYVRYRFAVVRSPVPNAFALGDGQIYVHAGLLALLENEAQIAAVLAHEIVHVEGHHSIVNARQARQKAGGMLAIALILGGDLGGLVNIALQAAVVGYGRDLERAADQRAIEPLLAAGYDPREMPRVFELLEQDPEGERLPISPVWSDHPLAQARKAYTLELLEGLAPRIAEVEAARGGLVKGEQGFAESVAEIAKDCVELYVDQDRPRSALILAKKVAARWPDDAGAHAALGEAWRALDARAGELPEEQLSKKAKRSRLREHEEMTREEREAKRRSRPDLAPILEENARQSEAAYRRALELEPAQPTALRGLGYLLEERGQLADAGRCWADYLKARPDAPDRPLVLRHLASITASLRGAAP